MRSIPYYRRLLVVLVAGSLVACSSDETVTPPDIKPGPVCDTVAWDLLLTTDEPNLSSYRLFDSADDPTANPADTGLPYDLNADLFTDYASKYRFVFMPCDSAATYVADEAFVFPVGTAITKTFAMPADTAERGFAHETLLETRVMIKRSTGWVTLTYVWLPDGSDAVLNTAGANQPTTVTHNGAALSFTYRVPSQTQCAACHTLDGVVVPIGPKARNLHGEFAYETGAENQLSHWQAAGQLDGLPADLGTIRAMPYLDDNTDLAVITDETERDRYAKAYLDINCAHCHRPTGAMGDRTPYFEFWRDIDMAVPADNHGICRVIDPGNANGSGLSVMMRIRLMPKIGTSVVHQEGLAMMQDWIANMSYICP